MALATRRAPRRPTAAAWLVACVLAAAAAAGAAAEGKAKAGPRDERVARLRALEAASAEAPLVELDEDAFNSLALSRERPYHLVLFASASRHMDSKKLRLRELKKNFAAAGKAFKEGPDADKVFFVDIWADKSPALFARLKINGLPAVIHWGPIQAGTPSSKKITIPETAWMDQGAGAYPWSPVLLAEFVKGRTGLQYAPMPSRIQALAQSPYLALYVLGAAAAAGLAAFAVYSSPLVRWTWPWAAGAVAMYGFSTSGLMFNLIRGLPMYVLDQKGKVVWWLSHDGSAQLGAEGLFMGSTYVAFSALISLLAYGLPRVGSGPLRGALSLAAAGGAVALGKAIFDLHEAKTGLVMRSFFSE